MTNLAPLGGLSVRFVRDGPLVDAAVDLRAACFGVGADAFDGGAEHLVVMRGQAVVAALRVTLWADGAQAGRGYVGTQYDMAGWRGMRGPVAEVGRLCVMHAEAQADVFRVIWGAMAGYVVSRDVGLLFGCATFEGLDPAPYGQGFGWLRDSHLGPRAERPGIGAAEVLPLDGVVESGREARAQVPAVLRGYLSLGAWVGDHVVVDRALGTLHVFCALRVRAVPPARRRSLMALAAQLGLR